MSKIYKDVIERAAWTAAQAFLAIYTVGGVDELKSAATAGIAAAISVVKGFAATKVGDSGTAATLKS